METEVVGISLSIASIIFTFIVGQYYYQKGKKHNEYQKSTEERKAKEEKESQPRSKIQSQILKLVEEKPMSQGVLAKELKKSRRAIRTACNRLMARKAINMEPMKSGDFIISIKNSERNNK